MEERMEKNYLELFFFPDIPWQPYPVYSVSEKGRIYSFKNTVYPNPTSMKRFTRMKQLKHRSSQAKMFDMLINIGYWDPLVVVREFPVVIQNHLRTANKVSGGFFLLDYFFPTLGLAVELDSEYHNGGKDELRDKYLMSIGIKTFRMSHLERTDIQKTKFKELCKEMRGMTPREAPMVFSFTDNIRRQEGL
jgi:hypothetical protein